MSIYLRAFIIALKMTLRGQTPPTPPNSELWAWIRRGSEFVDAIYAATETNQTDKTAWQARSIRIDGRDLSAEVILATLRYHFSEEYPYLLRHPTAHNITAIHANNLNDHYWLQQLLAGAAGLESAIRQPLTALSAHLDAIPPEVQSDPPLNH